MNINFEINSYLSAVKEKAHLNSESEIFNYAKAGLQFKYVDVSIKEFKQKYSPEGWVGRKVIALPAAIWSGIVKTIYHLAKAILVGVIACSGGNNYLKAQFFYIARDLQESLGWSATLLNDRYGQYHIQESGFHKSCYNCFLTNNTEPDSPQQGNANTTYRTDLPSTTSFPKPPYFSVSDSTNFTKSQLLDKQSVINRMMKDPNSFPNLNYDLKNDENVVAAALSGCKNSEEAKKVISNAHYDAKNSKKVAFALVKIDPTLLGQLNYNAKNDEDVVVAALNGCKNSEQAKKVISNAHYNVKNSKKVALVLVKIDPTLLGQLNSSTKNDLNVVLLAIELSTEHTIQKIWSSVGINAQLNKEVRTKVKEKYPYFFLDQTFNGAFPNFSQYGPFPNFSQHGSFPNFFQHRTFYRFPSSNTQRTSHQTPQVTVPIGWSEPDDLKSNTSDGANIVRRILKQNHLLGTDLTKTNVSKEKAKGILCQLLELDKNPLDKDIKKSYLKTVLLIHPDKLKLQSSEEAFKVLNAAYKQADLQFDT